MKIRAAIGAAPLRLWRSLRGSKGAVEPAGIGSPCTGVEPVAREPGSEVGSGGGSASRARDAIRRHSLRRTRDRGSRLVPVEAPPAQAGVSHAGSRPRQAKWKG